jgi:hypothetical protein
MKLEKHLRQMIVAQLTRLTYEQRLEYVKDAHEKLGFIDFMAVMMVVLELPISKGGVTSEDIQKLTDHDPRKSF